jgi:hypothetical protein
LVQLLTVSQSPLAVFVQIIVASSVRGSIHSKSGRKNWRLFRFPRRVECPGLGRFELDGRAWGVDRDDNTGAPSAR